MQNGTLHNCQVSKESNHHVLIQWVHRVCKQTRGASVRTYLFSTSGNPEGPPHVACHCLIIASQWPPVWSIDFFCSRFSWDHHSYSSMISKNHNRPHEQSWHFNHPNCDLGLWAPKSLITQTASHSSLLIGSERKGRYHCQIWLCAMVEVQFEKCVFTLIRNAQKQTMIFWIHQLSSGEGGRRSEGGSLLLAWSKFFEFIMIFHRFFPSIILRAGQIEHRITIGLKTLGQMILKNESCENPYHMLSKISSIPHDHPEGMGPINFWDGFFFLFTLPCHAIGRSTCVIHPFIRPSHMPLCIHQFTLSAIVNIAGPWSACPDWCCADAQHKAHRLRTSGRPRTTTANESVMPARPAPGAVALVASTASPSWPTLRRRARGRRTTLMESNVDLQLQLLLWLILHKSPLKGISSIPKFTRLRYAMIFSLVPPLLNRVVPDHPHPRSVAP